MSRRPLLLLLTLSWTYWLAATAWSASVTSTWTGGSGSWSDATHWTAGVPQNNATDTFDALIDGGNAVASTVTVDVDTSVDQFSIDAGDSLIISGVSFLFGPFTTPVNRGTIRVQDGGSLGMSAGTIDNTGGLIEIDHAGFGSPDNGHVTGGNFHALNDTHLSLATGFADTHILADATSDITFGGGDSGLYGVTFEGGSFTLNGSFLGGTITNFGSVHGYFRPFDNPTIDNHGQLTIDFSDPSGTGDTLTLTGGGSVTLGPSFNPESFGRSYVVTNVDNQIRGSTRLFLASNGGLVEATGGTLQVGFTPSISHTGVFSAATGATLEALVPVTGTGSWHADGGAIHTFQNVSTTGDVELLHGSSLTADAAFSLGNLVIDDTSTIDIHGLLSVAGNVDMEGTASSRFVFQPGSAVAAIRGGAAAVGDWTDWQSFEIAGRDEGQVAMGFTVSNAYLPDLVIGTDGRLYLRDARDNGNRAVNTPEALYVDTLEFADALGILNLNGLKLYYNHLIGSASQIIDVPVPEPGLAALVALTLAALALRRSGTTAQQV